jgi:hypothetical protein
MQILAKALLAFIVLGSGVLTPAIAQNSSSILGILFDVSPLESRAMIVKNSDERVLDNFKWMKGLPAYVEFSLPAKTYTIDFPGPIRSIQVETSSGAQTFVQYVPITTENGEPGVQITVWRGKASATIRKAISDLKEANTNLMRVTLGVAPPDNKILLSTDPPWSGPFDPPPPPPRK